MPFARTFPDDGSQSLSQDRRNTSGQPTSGVSRMKTRWPKSGKEEHMNDSGMQMTAGVPLRPGAKSAAEPAARASCRSTAAGGLDTGARGWRWLTPATRQMQAGAAAQQTNANR